MGTYDFTVYGAPMRAASLVLDGELTGRGLRNAILAPERLTPTELDGIRERMKRAAGSTSVGNALIDVGTDPFAWFFFLTTPLGGASVSASWTKMARSVSPYIREQGGVMRSLGLLTTQQVARGTTVHSAMMRFEEGIKELSQRGAAERFETELSRVLERHGLAEDKGLVWRAYARGSREQQIARDVSAVLRASLEGWDKSGTELRVVFRSAKDVARAAARGHTVREGLGLAARERPSLVGSRVERSVERLGLGALRDAARSLMDDTAGQVMLGKDDLETGRKWVRILRGQTDPAIRATVPAQERGIARKVLGGLEAHLKGGGSEEAFLREMGALYGTALRHNGPSYYPRAVFERWAGGPNARLISGDESLLVHRTFGPGLRAAASTKGRVAKAASLHPEDWEHLDQVLELSPHGRKLADKASQQYGQREPMLWERLDWHAGLQKYVSGQRRTYAMFVQDVGDELRAVNRETRHAGMAPNSRYQGGASVGEAIADIERGGKAPAGGFSVADVLSGDMQAINEAARPHGMPSYTARTISHVIIPHAMGVIPTHHALAAAAVNHARQLTGAFMATGVATEIERSGGKFGAKAMQAFRRFAQEEDTLRTAGRLNRGLAKWMYVPYLGLNVASAMLNMTQPFLHAMTWLGPRNIAHGYAQAFKDVGRYLGARQRQHGWRAISAAQRDELIQKTIRFHDEVGISSVLLENLERITFSGEAARRAVPRLGQRIFFELPMKLFEKAEWMNRSVVAHATARALGREGVRRNNPLFRNVMRQVVDETQFGGHWMNTPIAFLPKLRQGELSWFDRLLQNPFIRQFLGFQVRMLTGALETGPKLAGREGLLSKSGLAGLAHDTSRALGASAVGVYLARDLFKSDIERAGYAAAVTDVIPFVSGGRFDPDEETYFSPPLLDTLQRAAVAMTSDDRDFLREVLPRVVPGGLQIQRTLEASPKVSAVLQRKYADWDAVQQDQAGVSVVPIYEGNGSLLGYEPVMSVVSRGLGFAPAVNAEPLKVERALASNREQVIWYRRQAITALMSGNVGRYQSLGKEFEKRFGLPLVITRQHMEQARRMRAQTRPERMYEQLPADVKPIYEKMVGGLPGQQFDERAAGTTPPQAAAARGATPTRHGSVSGGESTPRERDFAGFTSFAGFAD